MSHHFRGPGRSSALAVLAATTLGLTTLGLAGPASAARVSVPDPADSTASLHDLRRVVVNHGAERLRVKVWVTDLRRHSQAGPAGLSIFLDTNASRRGPELRLGTGLQDGTDYQLVRMRGWRTVGDPLTCRHHLTLDPAEDMVRFSAHRRCLGSPDAVRVAVRMRDDFDDSHPVVDWMTGRRAFTPWVASD